MKLSKLIKISFGESFAPVNERFFVERLHNCEDLPPSAAQQTRIEELEARLSDSTDNLVTVTKKLAKAEAQLAKVTAERDGWSALLADAYGAILDWDEVLKDRADQEAIAAIPRAFRIGLEDAAQVAEFAEGIDFGIRALPTPTDLVQRAMKETN